MSVRKPPKEEQLNAFLDKGGDIAADKNADEQWTMITLRMPVTFLNEIDKQRKSKIGMSRNVFILQLIQQQLEKDV